MANYNPYKENGYKDRNDYLKSMADDYGVSLYAVQMVAELLGESEDFDGLVSELESMEGM